MYRTTVRRTSTMTRAEEAVDTTAIDAKAAAGKDTTAVGKPAADMKERWPRDDGRGGGGGHRTHSLRRAGTCERQLVSGGRGPTRR
jgi:hypothetical protein